MTGWIQLHRGWRDCEVFSDEPMTEREAWVWLIEKAAWKPCARTNAKGERIMIERGQYHTSLRNLASAWGWGKNKVDRFLARLSDHEMIGTVAGQSGCLITVCNYDKYQDDRDSDQRKTGTVAGQSRDTQEQRKQIKQENTPLPPRGIDVPEWVPLDAWQGFSAMRKSIKKPMTARAVQMLVKKLDGFRSDGCDLAAILDASTINGWQDIYPPKAAANGYGPDHSGIPL